MTMIRRYPPNRMFSILIVLLAMAAYFSYDLYTRDNQLNKHQIQFSGSTQPKSLPQKTTPQATIPQISNTQLQVSRPENILIRPGTILIMQKKYTKCRHVISTKITAPPDMVNLTEGQLRLAFKRWEITKFSPEEVIMLKKIQTKCSHHFILKEKDGFVAVYYQQPIDGIALKEVTPLLVKNLPQKEKSRLKDGIMIESPQALAQTLEDLGS